MRKSLAIVFFLFFAAALFAQKTPFRYGNISNEELTMEACSFYPEANAMILGETGELYFTYDGEKGWQYTLEVTVRKKIFRQAGMEEANVTIRLYDPAFTNRREKMEDINGTTYNLVGGKVEKTKLKSADKYENRINDYWTELTFTFPNVQAGSVLEYRYKIVSDFMTNLRTWHFQHDIPTAVSQFHYVIPDRFKYQVNQLGDVVQLEDKQDRAPQIFRYRWERIVPGKGTERGQDEFESICLIRTLTAQNVAPVIEEPFQSNRVDLPSRIHFQLVSVETPGRPVENVAESYESFNRRLLENDHFGKKLSHGKFAEQLVDSGGKSQTETAAELLSKLQNHFAWNEALSYFGSNAGAKVFKEKTGSAGDINLSLVAAFRAVGLQAHPVILNTLGSGVVHPVYPNFENFNYVVALVEADGKSYFADAVSGLPLGMLPKRCLNGKGWMVAEQGQWVDLKPAVASSAIASIDLSIVDDHWQGRLQFIEKGYPGYESYARHKANGEEGFSKFLAEGIGDWSIDKVQFDGITPRGEIKYALDIKKALDDEEIIYLQPLMLGTYGDNPFTRPTRNSLVEFPYGFSQKVIFKLTVPEGYAIEFPPAEKVTLFEDAAYFAYQPVFDPITRTFRIAHDFILKQTAYTPAQYEFLREFFHRMELKNKEMIVLRHE